MKSKIPFFCDGCPHLSTHSALKEVLEGMNIDYIINGDIGCYELAGFGNNDKENFEPMRELIDTLLVMGSGVAISQGMYHSGYKGKLISLTGDSTFFHSSFQGLVNAVQHKVPMTYIVFDNSCTAMTGQQVNASYEISIKDVISSLGISFVEQIQSYDSEKLKETLKRAIEYDGISVVISKSPCVHLKRKLMREK